MNEKLTLLIFSCDKFSDLWKGHVQLLEKNWPDRNMRTYIVTDTNHQGCSFPGIEILEAGEGVEWSDRLGFVLAQVTTDYVFVTLDDYYPIYPIETARIDRLVDIAEKEQLDYIRLFHRPWSWKTYGDYADLYEVDLWDDQYAVNLYAGIWRTDFMRKTVREPLNAWMFEVSLTKVARELSPRCIMSKGKEFPTLDVIRKGKILRKANRYFHAHPGLYSGNREVMRFTDEAMLEIQTIAKKLMPEKMVKWLKAKGRKHGMTFYSD